MGTVPSEYQNELSLLLANQVVATVPMAPPPHKLTESIILAFSTTHTASSIFVISRTPGKRGREGDGMKEEEVSNLNVNP